MTHVTPEEGRRRLPLPPTRQWPQGVFDVELFARGHVRVSYFAPRGEDRQGVHSEDEIYVVIGGDATFAEAGCSDREVFQGDMLFVSAGVAHRFSRIGKDFEAWVIFFRD